MVSPYDIIDRSLLLNYLFYPRRQHTRPSGNSFDLEVQVEKNVALVCRAYPVSEERPWILFFHGNGEVTSDYDNIAPLYNSRDINLLVADYRGYGASNGKPTFQSMVDDALVTYSSLRDQLVNMGYIGKWLVMGRSLGSISALELASRYDSTIKGLIVESGFISVSRLVHHLGLPSPGNLTPLEERCKEMVKRINLPSLVIHGDRDQLVPLDQGKELYEHLGSVNKQLLIIPDADHNDIMFIDAKMYMDGITDFFDVFA